MSSPEENLNGLVTEADDALEAAREEAARKDAWRRPKAPREERRFDKTQLRAASLGYTVHRDYAAHFFRWGFARRWVKRNNREERRARVLDVGCGQDLPLLKVIRTYPQGDYIPELYVGVDLNKLTPFWKDGTAASRWVKLFGQFSFVDDYPRLLAECGDVRFDVITCFEVIEHMDVNDGWRLLHAMRACLAPGGVVLLSTPVFNGKAARNHVHEYEVAELNHYVTAAGFAVEQRFGTFASYPDMKKHLKARGGDNLLALRVLDGIRAFYSDETAACFLAPLYPDASRNNVWVLRHANEPSVGGVETDPSTLTGTVDPLADDEPCPICLGAGIYAEEDPDGVPREYPCDQCEPVEGTP